MASLGNDLASIRKQQDLTLEDIHRITKIPTHILKAIENDTIFTDFEENKTYIRSYVRSYAKALKLDDGEVVQALDDFEVGIYSGRLLGRDIGEHTDKHEAPPPPEEPEPPKETPERDRKSDMVHDHAPKPAAKRPALKNRQEHVEPPPSVSSVDWHDMVMKFTPLQKPSRMWLGIVIILLLVAAVVLFWFYRNNPDLLSRGDAAPETTQNISQPAVVPDSLQLNLTDTQESQVAGQTTALSDTLRMLIYAAYGKLEPVRVYTDVMGELNPYWIEEGDAVAFEFADVIGIRGQYSRMELLVNGHPLENFRQRFYRPDTTMVVIERNVFENDRRWLQPPPDSTELGFVPPTRIMERPIFN